jgi:hypothetical protein
MYGEFWSYRGGFNGCIPGLGMPGMPYSGSYPDRFGNVRPNTARKRGETVPEWIAREVRAAVLSVRPEVHAITDGQGFIIGHRRIPWYQGRLFTVQVARDWGERGKYRVWVNVYVVDLVKRAS